MANPLKKIISLFIIFLLINKTNAQIGIGINPPDPSAMLHVQDTARGMLIPRMSSAQRIAIQNPAEGLLVYQLEEISSGFWYFSQGQWRNLSSSNNGGKATVVLADTITNAEAQLKIASEVGPNTQEIRIMRCTNLTSVDLSMLNTMLEVYISDNPVLQQVNFSNLTSVDGGFYVYNCPLLTNLSIAGLTRIGRTFNGTTGITIVNTHLATVNLPVLRIVAGAIRITNDSSLTSISMAQLTACLAQASGGVDVSSNPALTNLSLPSLLAVNQFKATPQPNLVSADLHSLNYVDFTFTFNCGAMASFSLPALANIHNTLDITGNSVSSILLPSLIVGAGVYLYGPALTSVSLPVLDSTSVMIFKGNAVTSISAPVLRTLGSLTIDSCASLTSVSFPSAVRANNINVGHCSSLASITFPALTSIAGYNQCNIYRNANLTSISFPSLASFQNVDFSLGNNKLPSTVVNALLHMFVTTNPIPVNRTFSLQQIPAAPPTGQGISDKATLVGVPYSNYITTD